MLSQLSMALTLLAPSGGGAPSDTIGIETYVDADALEVGGTYDLRVELAIPAALVASKAGAPAPFLQLDVPPSVRLTEPAVESYRDLAANEFLMEPYERLMSDPVAVIPFELVAEPGADERIGVNLVAYLSGVDGAEPSFLRRRFELPLVGGADAVEIEPARSDWGPDEQLLQIGDRVEAFSLPRGDGTQVDLDQWLGKRNLILTTYRAHW